MSMKNIVVFIIAVCLILIACKNKSESKIEDTSVDTVQGLNRKTDSLLQAKRSGDSIQLIRRKDSILLKLTQGILLTLKNKNYSAFANYIHPVSGIRFSPYGYIDTIHHIRFSRQKIGRAH